jgi:hypothetical protein
MEISPGFRAVRSVLPFVEGPHSRSLAYGPRSISGHGDDAGGIPSAMLSASFQQCVRIARGRRFITHNPQAGYLLSPRISPDLPMAKLLSAK